LPPVQTPVWQVSVCVQAFPSSQAFVLFVKTQPDVRVQVSVVHGLRSLQTIPTPVQEPPPQVSPVVHSLPSSQAFVLLVKTQPVAGLHVSVVQSLVSSQTTPVPVQVPPPHTSPVVQAFASAHAVPSAAFGFEHRPVPGAQTPATWH
jgi:hypothetical protein